MIPADSIDGFESDDDIFDLMDNNEHHILSNENITSYQRPETIVESSATHEPTLLANIASLKYQMQPSNHQMQLFSYVDNSQQQQKNTSNHATSFSTISHFNS
jgi:hypothetical protein